jgi:hypothetical protein
VKAVLPVLFVCFNYKLAAFSNPQQRNLAKTQTNISHLLGTEVFPTFRWTTLGSIPSNESQLFTHQK